MNLVRVHVISTNVKHRLKSNSAASMVLFTLQFLVAVTTPVEAAPRTPKITSIELNLDEGTMIITGRYFAWGDKFRGKVLLHLAETGPMTLNVDSYAKLQLTDGVPVRLDQLQVSGIPQNIDEFSGVHLLEVRRRYREQVDGVSVVRYKTGTSLVTIGSEGSVGPEGEQGEQGEKGEKGEKGENPIAEISARPARFIAA